MVTGEIYPPAPGELSLRTADPRAARAAGAPPFVVASAETLAYAVATGSRRRSAIVQAPRARHRPARASRPTTCSILRERRPDAAPAKRPPLPATSPARVRGRAKLELVEGLAAPESKADCAVFLSSLDEVRQVAARVTGEGPIKAVIAPFIPSGLVPIFAGAGILALGAEPAMLRSLKGQKSLALSPVSATTDGAVTVTTVNKTKVNFSWLAVGVERSWTFSGTSRPPAAPRARTP